MDTRARMKEFGPQLVKEGKDFSDGKALASAEADEGLARLNFSYTTVTAPFAGRVINRLVTAPFNFIQEVKHSDKARSSTFRFEE